MNQITCPCVISLKKSSELSTQLYRSYKISTRFLFDTSFLHAQLLYYQTSSSYIRSQLSLFGFISFCRLFSDVPGGLTLLHMINRTRLLNRFSTLRSLRKDATVHRLHWLKKGQHIDFEHNLWIPLLTCSHFSSVLSSFLDLEDFEQQQRFVWRRLTVDKQKASSKRSPSEHPPV